MEVFQNKKVAIPVGIALFLAAIAAAWWGISRMPQSGGVQTTNIKGEAALAAGAAADTAELEQMSVEQLQAVIKQRKMVVDAATSYNVESEIKMAKDSLERAEAVLRAK